MSHKTLLSRGKKLFPGHTASPVPCGRVVFHGDEPSFTIGCFQSFSVENSTLIQATTRDSAWWKRRKQTILSKGWGDSTLSRGFLALDLLENNVTLEIGNSPYRSALLAHLSSIQHSSSNQDNTERMN